MLLIRRSSFGDVLLVEPVARALRHALGARVDLLTSPPYAALAREAMGFAAVIEDNGLLPLRDRLPVARYDVVIDLQNKLRTRFLARHIPALRRVHLQKRSRAGGLLALVGHDPPIHDRHNTEIYFEALRSLGVTTDVLEARFGPELHISEPFRFLGPGRRLGLCPGASRATKRWPPERFGQLADRLFEIAPDLRVVLVGGPEDRSLLSAVRAAIHQAPIEPVDLSAEDVLGLARVVSAMDLMVSGDTGPAHLAFGLGVPTVVLFGPTSSVRWGPRGPNHRVVTQNLDCAPCSNIGAERCPRPDRNHACMQTLGVEPVFETVRALWSGEGPA